MSSKTKVLDRTSAEMGIYVMSLLHLLLIEVVFAGIAFFGVLDVAFINPATMLWLEIIAFVISLVMWIVVITVFKKYFISRSGIESAYIEERGGAMFSSASVYFFVVTVMHAIFSVAWVIWQANYGDLSPLNFTVNLGPFIIARDLLTWQFVALFIALFFFVYDIRHQKQLALARDTNRTLVSLRAESGSSNS